MSRTPQMRWVVLQARLLGASPCPCAQRCTLHIPALPPVHFTAATEEDLEEVKKGQAVAEEMSAGTTAASDEASSSASSEDELVEYEGMLVSAAAAQRRR